MMEQQPNYQPLTAEAAQDKSKWIFEFKCDTSMWLFGFSFGSGKPDSYWGKLKYLCFNFLCFSWMIYCSEDYL